MKKRKTLLRKLRSKKYRAKYERTIKDKAATLAELVARARSRAKGTGNALRPVLEFLEGMLLHRKNGWSKADQEIVLSLIVDPLPKPKGRKKGSVTKNRKPKKSDALVAIALAVLKDKEQRPTAKIDDLITERLEAHSPSLHDSETKNLTTVRNWVMKRPRAELMRRAASAGLVPPQ